MKYNIDTPPYTTLAPKENLSCDSGNFICRGETRSIHYRLHTKVPISWVSMLVLMSVNEENTLVESICIVTYEVIDYDIVINTGNATGPILCPLKLIYVGVPIEMSFAIENRSPIPGCFYFLKPNGTDSDKITIEFSPNSSELKPFKTMNINVTLCCSDIGIFEDIFVPCFVGRGQAPIILRVLCAVDGVHVCFYLPDERGTFRKIVWPPKVVYDYDYNWGVCPCEQQDCMEYETNSPGSNLQLHENSLKTSYGDPSGKSNSESSTTITIDSDQNWRSLELILRDKYKDDLFLLEEIVEIHNVSIRTPRKFTIFMENITPITTSFNMAAQNFPSNNISEKSTRNVTLRTNAEMWRDLGENEYGILVLPELENGELAGFKYAAIDIWIYANTYGIYSEEIIVDIPEIPAFGFSLLIEVVGSPIALSMALNSLTECPIIRFGCIQYDSPLIERRIKISNTSCIPIHIVWHTFLAESKSDTKNKINVCFDVLDDDYDPARGNFILFDEYLGEDTQHFCGTVSKEIDIVENSSTFIEVFLNPEYFSEHSRSMDITCYIIGHIYLKNCHRQKVNYFYRKTGWDVNQIKMKLLATLEWPVLELDLMYRDSKLIIYANEVIFQSIFIHYVRLVFRNNNQSKCTAELKLQDPFSMRDSKNRMMKKKTISINGSECEESIPIDMFIYFPNIMVKPTTVKFESVLLNTTRKTLLSVYNLTGCAVKFEIYKSSTAQAFYVTPHFGEIRKSSGINKQFVDIFIYFSPRECKAYQESIRIVTNIPNYFIEVPVKGTGTVNEKFYVNYKI
ncbi:hypothetical protein JTB14_025991 [Gonioctena quinquepunctata]|nr:hypothetical protein JTB14_025991 [Gonioctena quinquepunctata]